MPRSQQPMNEQIIQEFRANKGQIISGKYQGASLLLLHTKGAKSGEERVNPMAYSFDENRLLVVASNNGVQYHPGWYLNILAHPIVEVELGTERFEAQVRMLQGEERDIAFHNIATRLPIFFTYEKTAHPRLIPVVELIRQESQRPL